VILRDAGRVAEKRGDLGERAGALVVETAAPSA
jgi:hypothetical protein